MSEPMSFEEWLKSTGGSYASREMVESIPEGDEALRLMAAVGKGQDEAVDLLLETLSEDELKALMMTALGRYQDYLRAFHEVKPS